MPSRTLRWRSLVVAMILGVLVSLASGLVENPPEANIIGAKYYGHPLVWRVVIVSLTNHTDFRFTGLAIDVIVWFAISFLALVVLEKITHRPG